MKMTNYELINITLTLSIYIMLIAMYIEIKSKNGE